MDDKHPTMFYMLNEYRVKKNCRDFQYNTLVDSFPTIFTRKGERERGRERKKAGGGLIEAGQQILNSED